MIKSLSFLILIIFQTLIFSTHEYYVSLTEIKHNPDKQRLEIIARIFSDDFEEVLKARYDQNLEFKPIKQSENIETYIRLYFDKKFNIKIDHAAQNIDYLGYKFKDDQVHFFLKIENITDFRILEIQNLLLTDVIEKQKNIVHCFKLQQKESVLLTRYDSEAVLKFE